MASCLPPEKLGELRQLIHGHVSEAGVQEQIKTALSEIISEHGGSTLDEDALLAALDERGLVEQVVKTLNLSRVSKAETELSPSYREVEAEPPLGRGGVGGNEAELSRSRGRTGGDDEGEGGERGREGERHKETPRSPQHLHCRLGSPDAEEGPADSLVSRKRCLYVQVLSGRAFLDHLIEPTPTSCHQCHSHFVLHVLFRGQRFHSRHVPCACEPKVNESFLLELTKCCGNHSLLSRNVGEDMLSYSNALGIADPIELVLTKSNDRGEGELVGVSSVQWRQLLTETSGRSSVTAEMGGVSSEAKITAGLLDLKLELIPKSTEILQTELLSAQLSLERQRNSERERLFLVYAKQWWKEFLQIRAAHSQRLVKIFAPDERGISHPVCCYITPLRAGRLLDSPRHAARFVSLMPFEKRTSVGSSGGCADSWTRAHCFIALRKGDVEDHTVLLCSLLLGFGLEAYVVIGTKSKGHAHTWVMTLGAEDGVTFWESVTGQRYVQPEFNPNKGAGKPLPLPTHPYRTIGCVFNHQSFYANAQPSEAVSVCRFDLTNESLWKAMSKDAIRSVVEVCGGNRWYPPLFPSRLDSALTSNEMEIELRTLTEQHREDLELATVWDNDLCYLLNPALSSYETERCLGVGGVCNEEFQDAIRRSVPDGHTFKGFPIQLLHRNPRKAFYTCLQSPVCNDILGCRGDQVRLAVRVKVYPYPEDICAVWVMFAVKYRSIL